jgi:hypothetical protein
VQMLKDNHGKETLNKGGGLLLSSFYTIVQFSPFLLKR